MATGDQNSESKQTAYPYSTLAKSVEMAKAIADLGGSNADVQKSVVAHRLGVSESAPSLGQNLFSAKAFGLIEGRGSYRLTEIGKRLLFPIGGADGRTAVLEAVRCPLIFASLIDRFDGGKVPDASVLANLIHREHRSVSPSWRPRVAALFLSTLREAQLIDAGGFLRYGAAQHGAEATRDIELKASAPGLKASLVEAEPSATRGAGDVFVANIALTVWQYKGIRVQTPEQMSADLWKKLLDYVNVLKPDDIEGE